MASHISLLHLFSAIFHCPLRLQKSDRPSNLGCISSAPLAHLCCAIFAIIHASRDILHLLLVQCGSCCAISVWHIKQETMMSLARLWPWKTRFLQFRILVPLLHFYLFLISFPIVLAYFTYTIALCTRLRRTEPVSPSFSTSRSPP